ncbi:MAG: hypothetical protein C0407_02900 [Desulfobacca sp.]|nr:hypothetical protein [Desulfobacca sp.]
MKIKEIVPLKSIVEELWLGENSVIDPLVPAVIEAWVLVVPPSLRSGIYLEGFRDGTLYLVVSNPVVGQQFQFLKESIREKINEQLGKPAVKMVRVKPGAPWEGASEPKRK